MAKGMNGNILKWAAILLTLGLAAAGWVYSLGVQREQLTTNCKADDLYHPQVPILDTRVARVEENVKSMNQSFAEFQRQTLANQNEILRALRK